MTALLHTFLAETLHLGGSATIILDNAKGLPKTSACSERRRKYEAKFAGGGNRSKVSRWESEVPALVTISNPPPAAPKRPESEAQGSPQIPRRRISVEEEEHNMSLTAYRNEPQEPTSHSRSSLSTTSSRSTYSEGSADYALAPPRRRTSCIDWLDEVEANDQPLNSPSHNDLPAMKLQLSPKKSPTDMLIQIDAGSSAPKSGGHKLSSKTKSAPRRPRRMKSMDRDEGMETPESPRSRQSESSNDESGVRLALMGSINSVMKKVKEETSAELRDAQQILPRQLTSSEKTFLEEAVMGVVGALSRRSASSSSSRSNPPDVVSVSNAKSRTRGGLNRSASSQRREETQSRMTAKLESF